MSDTILYLILFLLGSVVGRALAVLKEVGKK